MIGQVDMPYKGSPIKMQILFEDQSFLKSSIRSTIEHNGIIQEPLVNECLLARCCPTLPYW